jgi:hypothetical protein
MSLAQTLLIRSVGVYARLEHRVSRLNNACLHAAEALLSQALSPAEKTELTVHLYEIMGQRQTRRDQLFQWEEAWYRLQLPAAPADVLLGGAGDGREARWLTQQGYRVFAFEPAPHALAKLRASVGARGLAVSGSYTDLCRAALQRDPIRPLSALCARRYDAVILGWGSFSHVFGPAAQLELLRVAATLAPEGPVLASFFLASQEALPDGRAARLGKRVGERLGRWRGLQPPHWREFMLTHAGMLHLSTRAELEQLAAALGRGLALETDDYAHATFLRPV